MDIEQVLDYQITHKLGIGGHVTLYAAQKKENPEKKFIVSVYDELLAQNPEIVKNFQRFMPQVVELEHQNIVKTIEFCVAENYLATITEVLPGQNLQFIILIRGLSRTAKLDIYKQILKAVEFAHNKGVIHNNFKPSNIIVPEKFTDLKIIDFGNTNVIFYDNPRIISEFTFESPMYMSPEFVSGKPTDILSDIYSLGVLFFFLFSHKTPYLKTAPNKIIVEHIINDPMPEINAFEKINEIIAKATAKQPNLRYQSISELLKEVETL